MRAAADFRARQAPRRPAGRSRDRGWLALLCLACALATAPAVAVADTLVAANGDRISGRLVKDEGGRIVFDSELFGRLDIASDQVRVEPGPAAPADTADADAVAVSAPSEGEAPTPAKWSLDTGLKLGADRGDLDVFENRLDGRLVFDRRTALGELHGTASYKYKTDEDGRDDNDWTASLSYDQFLSDERFRSTRVRATRELSDDRYDSTRVASVAAGWRLWETSEHYLRIGPAAGYLSATRADESFSGPFVGLYARAKAPLRHVGELSGELQLADTLGDGRYVDFELRLRRPLTDRLFTSLSWNYVWSEFAIESGYESEWRWDLGWRFGAVK